MKKALLILGCIVATSTTFANDFTGTDQSLICVNLPVGVGYAASFYVTSENGFESKMTEKFNVGETRCIDVSAVMEGDIITTHVEPKLASNGKIIKCDPPVKKVPGKAITYKASGALWNAWCAK
ncbi:hypothetical protein GNP80_00200 [Aliivibrio fischeri]|uniref:hypothetical protein n=1 Tax=Aliivibrio fischeri TaxID=668 RepID=UPI0012D8F828|nr:hypothetical protein [Aliivibrio fischeri]MUK90875.1 hypothetical protein [Aliivibrio fischeri]